MAIKFEEEKIRNNRSNLTQYLDSLVLNKLDETDLMNIDKLFKYSNLNPNKKDFIHIDPDFILNLLISLIKKEKYNAARIIINYKPNFNKTLKYLITK